MGAGRRQQGADSSDYARHHKPGGRRAPSTAAAI